MSFRSECHKSRAFAFVNFILCISFDGQLDFFQQCSQIAEVGRWRTGSTLNFVLRHEPVKSCVQNGLYVTVARC